MTASSISFIPPGSGGVRDFASLIGTPLHAPLVELTQSTDTSGMRGDFALLHFSGYGFQKRGVPTWLVGRVRSLRSQFKSVGVVFHELFATGPVWGSAFWLHGYQKRIATQLLMLSDFWLANREKSAQWLLEQRAATPHRVLPVISNVGEPASIEGPRERRVVVFGSPVMRAQVYRWADGEIFRSAQRHGLAIHDIGPGFDDAELGQRLAQEKVVAHGKLPADEVSAALSTAAYGALVYPTDYASKSGIFAAYSSHGTCPILLCRKYDEVNDGLRSNVHYAAGFEALENPALDAQAIGRQARGWYEPHGLDAQVAALRSLISEARR
jgi:hypothetical protein